MPVLVPVNTFGMLMLSVPPGSGLNKVRECPAGACQLDVLVHQPRRGHYVPTLPIDPAQVAVLLEGGMIGDLLGVRGQPGAGFAVTIRIQRQPDQVAAPGLAVVAAPVDEVACVSVAVHGVP
jgi:hypothetical protein